MLLCIGASLRFSAFRGHAVPLIGAVISKLALFPFVLVSVGWWLGLGPLALAVLAATGAAPTASSSYALASELGGDAELMAEIFPCRRFLQRFHCHYGYGWLALGHRCWRPTDGSAGRLACAQTSVIDFP